jgi:DNA (cytosine-5)-methyltransferase 1
MLGFHRAGSESLGGVDSDSPAAESFARNFHGDSGSAVENRHAAPNDLLELDPYAFLESLGHRKAMDVVDVIVAGPPCPSFARIGRAKLREVHRHPEAFRRDPRAKLYGPLLEFIRKLQPVAVLIENVPDILNWGGHNVGEEVCESLDPFGYASRYTLLNAASYGVPQMRERFFLIAVHKSVEVDVSFPPPPCHVEFPRGYQGSRDVALRGVLLSSDTEPLFGSTHRYVLSPSAPPDASPAVTVAEAIGDLPPIVEHLEGKMKRGARRFTRLVPYPDQVAPSPYAQELRRWPAFEAGAGLLDHVTRSLSQRDYRLFRRMKPGDDYPRAHALAERLFEQALRAVRSEGISIDEESEDYRQLRAEFVPPYDHTKFPNKWRKMEPDRPARTVMAHIGKDSYTHIHYDSNQARVISVREAARLQSFPDGFSFSGTMNSAFRQIGNSVPPLLSFRLAKHLLRLVGASVKERAYGTASRTITRVP